MRRLFWLGAGLAAGALVVRKLTRKAESLTPAGIAGSLQDSAAGVLDTVREFVEEIREGMAVRESELFDALAGEGDLAELFAGHEDAPAESPSARSAADSAFDSAAARSGRIGHR
jgi:hypothetical protein